MSESKRSRAIHFASDFIQFSKHGEDLRTVTNERRNGEGRLRISSAGLSENKTLELPVKRV